MANKKRFPFVTSLGTSASLITLIAMGAVAPAHAQDDADETIEEEVIVRGMRSSIQNAQQLKREANKIQDSIVAEDIGKLPDRSIAEALQRVPGVTVSRFDQPGDPEHFAGEGAGVSIRGLPQVRAELNGRDIFSANDGRALSFDDVPAELMAGVDVYKSPTADMIEGGLGGIVNLRTRMPFDQDGQLISATVKANYGDVIAETNYEGSILYSNNWDTSSGRWGLLVDFSDSEISSRADNLYNRAYFPRDDIDGYDETVWVPKGADWRRNDYNRKREGKYLAIQYSPVESTEFYLTAFESDAERNWYENAFFVDAGNQPQPVSGANDWVLDGNIFQSGTLTSAQGVSLGTSSRLSGNESKTADYSTGVKWSDGPWTVNVDFQVVESSAKRTDYTLGTVVFPPRVRISNVNSDSGPTIVDVDNALADPDSYSFGQMMHRPADNDADSKSSRLDVQYDFEDSIVRSVKAGVRFSKKQGINREFTNWTARVQPWNIDAWTDSTPPTIGSSSLMRPYTFEDFQRGNANVPVDAWMFTTDAVDNFQETTDAMVAATIPPVGSEWAVTQPNFDMDVNDPANKSLQEEKSQAVYVMLDLEFTDQLSGNVGVRYVTTENKSEGSLNPPDRTIGEGEDAVQPWYFDPVPLHTENDYSHVLPSLNLRYDVSDEFVVRFAASKGIWKPEFWRLKNYWTFSVNNPDVEELEPAGIEDGPDEDTDVTAADINETNFHLVPFKFNLSSNGTNPLIEPMTANQYDLTAEWYFNDNGGMLYAGAFFKDVQDFFRTSVYTTEHNGITWAGDTYVNVGTADVSGFEIGGTYYFDSLPAPFNGFGITANYTYIDSSTDIPVFTGDDELGVESTVSPQDTDGTEIIVNELEGLAENTFNITLMYEYSAFYSRLAYNWSSGALQSIGPNGWSDNDANPPWRLPVFSDDYGQLDFSAGYNFNENLSLNFEAYNISQSETKGFMRQNVAGETTAFVYSQDTRYGLSLRLTY